MHTGILDETERGAQNLLLEGSFTNRLRLADRDSLGSGWVTDAIKARWLLGRFEAAGWTFTEKRIRVGEWEFSLTLTYPDFDLGMNRTHTSTVASRRMNSNRQYEYSIAEAMAFLADSAWRNGPRNGIYPVIGGGAFGAIGGEVVTDAVDSATTRTLTFPTISASTDDVLIAWQQNGSATEPSAPTSPNYTQLFSINNTTNGDWSKVWYLISASGGENSVTLTSPFADEIIGVLARFDGPVASMDGHTATTGASQSNSRSTGTISSANRDQNSQLAIAAWFDRRGYTPSGDMWSAHTNSFTEFAEPESSYKGISAAYKLLSASGDVESTASFSGSAPDNVTMAGVGLANEDTGGASSTLLLVNAAMG